VKLRITTNGTGTTRKSITAGVPKCITAGVYAFAGDHLAGGNVVSPAFFNSPVVTAVIPGALPESPAVAT
jgi:hypothetical protein